MHERSGGHLQPNASRLRLESSLMIKMSETCFDAVLCRKLDLSEKDDPKKHYALVLDKDTEYTVKEGMTLRVAGEDITIENVRRLDSGETVVTAEVSLHDGTYDAKIVTERITPITFLLN